MIFLIRKPVVLAAALMAIGLLGTSARADLVITVQENAGPITTFSVTGAAGMPTNDPFISVPTTVNTTDYASPAWAARPINLAVGACSMP